MAENANVLATVKDDLLRYANLLPKEPTSNEIILANLVSKSGLSVLQDKDHLCLALQQRGVSSTVAAQFQLLSYVRGYDELLTMQAPARQTDLERFVNNALYQTGLNREAVLARTAELASVLGIATNIATTATPMETVLKEQAYVIPASMYEQMLEPWYKEASKGISINAGKREEMAAALEPLVAAGLPKAKYCMAHYIRESAFYAEDIKVAYSLLSEAADAGDVEASAELGDYYYSLGHDAWSDAYELYTGFGALAQTPERQEAVKNILSFKQRNKKLLVNTGIMLAAVVLLLLLFGLVPSGVLSTIVRTFCIIIACGVYVVAILHFKLQPYDNYQYVPVTVFFSFVTAILFSLLF